MCTIQSIARKFFVLVAAASLLALALGGMGITPAYAQSGATWYVTPTGDNSASCAAPDAPCLTINAALGKAAAGDTIEVAIGTYMDTGTEVVLIGKAITLSGGWDAGFSAQSGLSIIDGQAARRGIYTTGNPVVIDHFQVQHGSHSYQGGGIYTSGALTLNNSIVSGNTSEMGGGIDNGGTLIVNNSTLSGNSGGKTGYSGGGGGGGIRSTSGAVVFNNSTVSGNTILGWFYGSGIVIYSGSSFTLNNSTVSGNTGGYQSIRADGALILYWTFAKRLK
jgi:hypothetical protein